jgi:large subunit ribosomal protein L29
MKGNIQELTLEELDKELVKSKEEIRNQRFQSVTGKIDNPKLIKELKKKIARINTAKRAHELGLISKEK